MTIVSVYDPGKMTGYARIEVGEPGEGVVILESDEVDLADMYQRFVSGAAVAECDEMVFESFIVNARTAKTQFQPMSLHLIGLATAHLHVAGRELLLQSPADAKTFADNKKLREYDWWHVGGEGHARDALRHAMLWCASHGYMKDIIARRK